MRWTRALLLIAIVAILGGVGAIYYARLKTQAKSHGEKPRPLASGISSTAQDWEYTQTAEGKPTVYVRAKDFQEVNNKFLLAGVELHIFHKDGSQYDLVKSAKAEFTSDHSELYSEGEVEITMGVPAEQERPSTGRLMAIKSSHVHFDTKSGKAITDQPASFHFDRGEGTCVGASYDPQTHELLMNSGVSLTWFGTNRKAPPMHVQSGDLKYAEKDAKVFLAPWSKLQRDTLSLNAGPAIITLSDKMIQQVDTTNAQGTDVRPNRNVEYAADHLLMFFDPDGQLNKLQGENHARLISTSGTGKTTITGDRVDLAMNTDTKESQLDTALATGHGFVENVPAAKNPQEAAETRILRSDIIFTKMRPGGQEVERVETQTPGSLEFVPNRPGQPHRWMDGERLWITYGPKNQIQQCRSVNVSTKTLKPRQKDAKTDPPPALTWSKNLLADFDPKTAQLARLEQWDDFKYQEGDRQAKAAKAVLEQQRNLIHLTGVARVWDKTGSTDAERIDLDQKSGDFAAEGKVNSTRLPDQKPSDRAAGKKPDSPPVTVAGTDGTPQSGSLLSNDEPLHATAAKMFSRESNTLIRYEGSAVAWQGANRLQADVIEINRDDNLLTAHGNVISELLDKQDEEQKPDSASKGVKGKRQEKAKKPPAAPVFTVVRAPDLVYDDGTKLADYKGGVTLERPDMTVKGQEIRAFLRDASAGEGSSLHHALADGNVQILSSHLNRKRTGTSEHAEYYVDDDKVILTGGRPVFVDSVKGTTHGEKLTWFARDDRLLVNGMEAEPAKSKIRRKTTE